MRSPSRLALFVAVATVFLGFAMVWLFRDQDLNGLERSLTERLLVFDQYRRRGASHEERQIAARPVREMGTNAIAYLMKWISDEPSPWRAKLRRAQYKMPAPLRSSEAL